MSLFKYTMDKIADQISVLYNQLKSESLFAWIIDEDTNEVLSGGVPVTVELNGNYSIDFILLGEISFVIDHPRQVCGIIKDSNGEILSKTEVLGAMKGDTFSFAPKKD